MVVMLVIVAINNGRQAKARIYLRKSKSAKSVGGRESEETLQYFSHKTVSFHFFISSSTCIDTFALEFEWNVGLSFATAHKNWSQTHHIVKQIIECVCTLHLKSESNARTFDSTKNENQIRSIVDIVKLFEVSLGEWWRCALCVYCCSIKILNKRQHKH